MPRGPFSLQAWQGEREGPHTDLERSYVVGEAIPMEDHPQGCQGDEEPAGEGDEADELVDVPHD